jgi:tetraacyldisaccharide-1-P 4'-kinase
VREPAGGGILESIFQLDICNRAAQILTPIHHHHHFSGKIWALQYDNGEEVSLLYTEKDTVRWVQG